MEPRIYKNIIDCRESPVPFIEIEHKRVTVNEGITYGPIVEPDGTQGADCWHILKRTIYTKEEWKELQQEKNRADIDYISIMTGVEL